MQTYSKAFLGARKRVEALKDQLRAAELALQACCPHVHLDGSSAFPHGISFTDCTLCGLSRHDLAKGGK